MKSETIALHYYKGIHQSRQINKATETLYRAKFLHEQHAITKIAAEMSLAVASFWFDVIIPVFCSRSRFCLPVELARKISNVYSVPMLDNFFEKPQNYNLSGKTVLVIDDVIQTGTTASIVKRYIEPLHPSKIIYIAYAVSPAFKSVRIV